MASSSLNLLIGCGGGSGGSTKSVGTGSTHPNATDYLNFFLNLEYLEAQFFLIGSTGSGLSSALTGGASAGQVIGGSLVPFKTPVYANLAKQIGAQEQLHVGDLRDQLFSGAVAMPNIDFTKGFTDVGSQCGLGTSFNPFADEISFLLGAMFIESIVASAYNGVLGNGLALVNSFVGIETAHAGVYRTLISATGGNTLTNANNITLYSNQYGGGSDQPITASILTAGSTSGQSLGRSPANTLHMLYQSPVGAPGSFFPKGFNGFIR